MRPAVVILGFVLGSAAAITFALGGTADRFRRCYGRSTRGSTAELAPLLVSVVLFALLTLLPPAAASTGRSSGAAWRARRVLARCWRCWSWWPRITRGRERKNP